MGVAILPQELVDLIIDELYDDKPTLSRCTLVSREWVFYARRHLFRTVDVHVRDRSLPAMHLAPLSVTRNIRHLSLSFGEVDLHDILLFLSRLHYLDTLRLRKLSIKRAKQRVFLGPTPRCRTRRVILDEMALDPHLLALIVRYIRTTQLHISHTCDIPPSLRYRIAGAPLWERPATYGTTAALFKNGYILDHLDIGRHDLCELLVHTIPRLPAPLHVSAINFRWLPPSHHTHIPTLMRHVAANLTTLSLNLSNFYHDDWGHGTPVPDLGLAHCPKLAHLTLKLASPLESRGVLWQVLIQLFAASTRTRPLRLSLALPAAALTHVGAFDTLLAEDGPARFSAVTLVAKTRELLGGTLDGDVRPLSSWERELVRERLPAVSKSGLLCFDGEG